MIYDQSYSVLNRKITSFARDNMPFKKNELNYLLKILSDYDNIRILDYGCNDGFLPHFIKKKLPKKKFEICGADINEHALNHAKKTYKYFKINKDFFSKEKFDLIIISHVLEHIKKRKIFLKQIKKILKKNGNLIITVPQERIRGDCTIPQYIDNIFKLKFENPHLVRINYLYLNKLLRNENLKITDHQYNNFFSQFTSKKRRFDSMSLITKCSPIQN